MPRRRFRTMLFELMVWIAVGGGSVGYFLGDPERRELALGALLGCAPLWAGLVAIAVALMMNRRDRENAAERGRADDPPP